MSTETKPYVSDEQIAQYASQYVQPNAREVKRACDHMRDIYEAHLAELRRERDEAVKVAQAIASAIEFEVGYAARSKKLRCPLCQIRMDLEDHMHECPYRMANELLSTLNTPTTDEGG